ncbi:PHP domain-containing protein [Flaviflexus salsibiostraticola]|uniref:PHP domain-containing protein n=1 Tax=Flaviflexus salsibiostraticola TaxID=1282737 RepID=A0A3Q8WT13_9ACTO|nr:PHP domain-containing protein [Flaviflexus salsibiostraticola]AZN29646.1 PHP domain-containing protein [Flaviflexus salsibiostraticola]
MIDLHTHSVHSDGTQSPQELMAEAASLGIHTVALTDHDTVAGHREAIDAVTVTGVSLVRGIEISARYEHRSVHLLGYLFDPHEGIAQHCIRLREARTDRLYSMVEAMEEDGLLTWQEVLDASGDGATLGRPHVADALLARGTVESRDDAFATLLSARSPYYRPYWAPELGEAVDLIHEAGGVAIWAHPRAVGRGAAHSWSSIVEGLDLGIDGLEVDHRDNPRSDRDILADIVTERGLIRTGSSDYHGTGKRNRLGENTTSPEMFEKIAYKASMEVINP